MSARRVVLACHGGSPLSQATTLVAEELERRGVARRGDEAGLEPGDEVVTLDGCESACTARRLAAAGRPAAASLELADFGVGAATLSGLDRSRLADEIAERLGRGAPRLAPKRPWRRHQAPHVPSRRAHTVDDYLLAIDALASPVAACGSLISDAPALAAHVSELLGVSRPSAGEMLQRMEGSGLIRRGARKELLLTEAGRVAADRAVRRQRLLEVFATAFLGYPSHRSHERARALEDSFDDDALERLRVALGDPDRCPHGWPIDPARARAEAEALTSLDALPAGEAAIVACLAESDPALERLGELGVVPGALVAADPAGARLFRLGGEPVRLDEADAAAVLVARRSSPLAA